MTASPECARGTYCVDRAESCEYHSCTVIVVVIFITRSIVQPLQLGESQSCLFHAGDEKLLAYSTNDNLTAGKKLIVMQ